MPMLLPRKLTTRHIAVSARHADVYALWGETHDQVREITARLRTEAARHDRTVRVSLSLRLTFFTKTVAIAAPKGRTKYLKPTSSKYLNHQFSSDLHYERY